MTLDNMIVILDPGNVGIQGPQDRILTMDTSRQHMTGGRMATVQPTHVRVPPPRGSTQTSAPTTTSPGPLGLDEVDVDKDNAMNMAVRYHGHINNNNHQHNHHHHQHHQHTQQNHHHTHQQKRTSSRADKRSTTEHSRRPESKRPGHGASSSGSTKCGSHGVDNKRASLPVSLALTTSKGLPLVLKNTNVMSEAGGARSVLLCPSDSEFQTWTLTPVVGLVLPEQLSVARPKSSCSSPTSCLSSEEVVEPPAPRANTAEDHQQPMPPVPPRGPNCYENIPVPGILPLGRKANSPTPVSQATEQTNWVNKDPISLYSRLSGYDSEKDKEKIRRAIDRLNASGFYYESVSAMEAKAKLRDAQVGTFLIRVSSQSSHLFALSVKTSRGTTSIRLAYENGNFRLDADPQSASKMPAFDCIIALIEYYVMQSTSDARNKCVFLESNGRRDTPVILTRPLRDQPQSLKHLCRRSLHYNHAPDTLARIIHSAPTPCSVQLIDYINSYPYAL